MRANKFAEKIRAASSADEEMDELRVLEGLERDKEELERSKRKHMHLAWVGLIWVMFGAAVLLLLVVAWHYLAPDYLRWLGKEEARMLGANAVAVLVGFMLRSMQRYM